MKPLQFLKETRGELRHVTWPSRRRAVVYAIVILLFSLAVGYTLGGFDSIFRLVLKTIVIK